MREKKSPIRLPRVACEITARGVAVLRSEGMGGIPPATRVHCRPGRLRQRWAFQMW